MFFNTASGGIHSHVVEPFAGTPVAVMQGARASLLAIKRLVEQACFAPRGDPEVPAPLAAWQERLRTGLALTERESKMFLAAHGIAVTRERLASNPKAAVEAAAGIGYPVALKIESPDLPHKTEVEGVRLGLFDAAAVEAGFGEIMSAARRHAPSARLAGVLVQEMVMGGIELIAGLSQQHPFGMCIIGGAGGVHVELLRDTALDLCPLDQSGARALVGRTHANRLLQGFRGQPVRDMDALTALFVRLSQIGAAYADVLETVDLNPVAVLPAGRGVRVLDALVIPRKPDNREPS